MVNILTSSIIENFLLNAPELEKQLEKVNIGLEPNYDPPFDRLVRSIIYQQLSGASASSIYTRFLDLLGTLTPERILELDEPTLRSAGLSRQKAGYVRNVAEAFQIGGSLSPYQSSADLQQMDADEIIQLFTSIKGVGRWTVEMYLIFGLGFLNIFSATDLGVRKGVQMLYNLDKLPTPGEAKQLTRHWDPYKTVGTLLCWRIQDVE